MTERTQISLSGRTVTLTPTDSPAREFFIPHSGGYVREYDAAGNCPQVCKRLNHRGVTLDATTPEKLLKIIRQEWHRMQKARAAS